MVLHGNVDKRKDHFIPEAVGRELPVGNHRDPLGPGQDPQGRALLTVLWPYPANHGILIPGPGPLGRGLPNPDRSVKC